jgi:endonuclease/exonuclease/phosphatase family metal-dependent hydrolase
MAFFRIFLTIPLSTCKQAIIKDFTFKVNAICVIMINLFTNYTARGIMPGEDTLDHPKKSEMQEGTSDHRGVLIKSEDPNDPVIFSQNLLKQMGPFGEEGFNNAFSLLEGREDYHARLEHQAQHLKNLFDDGHIELALLQESPAANDPAALKLLKDKFPTEEYYISNRNASLEQPGIAFVCKKELYQEEDTFNLEKAINEKIQADATAADTKRQLKKMQAIVIEKNGKKQVIFNVHFDYSKECEEAIRLATDEAKKLFGPDVPVLFAGDFNRNKSGEPEPGAKPLHTDQVDDLQWSSPGDGAKATGTPGFSQSRDGVLQSPGSKFVATLDDSLIKWEKPKKAALHRNPPVFHGQHGKAGKVVADKSKPKPPLSVKSEAEPEATSTFEAALSKLPSIKLPPEVYHESTLPEGTSIHLNKGGVELKDPAFSTRPRHEKLKLAETIIRGAIECGKGREGKPLEIEGADPEGVECLLLLAKKAGLPVKTDTLTPEMKELYEGEKELSSEELETAMIKIENITALPHNDNIMENYEILLKDSPDIPDKDRHNLEDKLRETFSVERPAPR